MHLPSLHIQRVRQLRELQIPELGVLNLITGTNNVGKSALLEAVYLFAKRHDPFALRDIVRWRGDWPAQVEADDTNEISDLLHFFQAVVSDGEFDLEHPRPIYVGAMDGTQSFEIYPFWMRPNEIASEATISPEIEGFDIEKFAQFMMNSIEMYYRNNKPYLGFKILIDGHVYEFSESLFHKIYGNNNGNDAEKFNVEYQSSSMTDDSNLAQNWDNISLTEKEDFVYEAMRTLHPGVDRIDFKTVGDHLRAFVKLRGHKQPILLSSLGEGIRRMFGLAMVIVNAEGGVALIDEVENGLHYSVQPRAWAWVFRLAQSLGVQVFATTHSRDCVQAFGDAARTPGAPDSRLIRLTFNQGAHRAVVYTPDEMHILTHAAQELR